MPGGFGNGPGGGERGCGKTRFTVENPCPLHPEFINNLVTKPTLVPRVGRFGLEGGGGRCRLSLQPSRGISRVPIASLLLLEKDAGLGELGMLRGRLSRTHRISTAEPGGCFPAGCTLGFFLMVPTLGDSGWIFSLSSLVGFKSHAAPFYFRPCRLPRHWLGTVNTDGDLRGGVKCSNILPQLKSDGKSPSASIP